MNKFMVTLAISAGLLGACGQVTSGDIRDAARQNGKEASASKLNFGIGQFWVSTQTSKTTQEFGTVRTTGVFDALAGNTQVSEAQDTVVDKAMRKTYVEAVDKNGFVIERVSRRTSAKFTQGSTTTEGNLSNVDTRQGYVVFELDSWVRMLVEGVSDNDLNPGFAVNPIAPIMNGVYTDDRGMVWKAVQVEPVANVNAVKLTRVFAPEPFDITKFFDTCFTRTPGAVAGTSNYDVKPECVGANSWIDNGGNAVFALEKSEDMWIGRQIVLKHVTKTVTISLDQIVCSDGTVNPQTNSFAGGLANCNGNVVFQNGGGAAEERLTEEKTDEVTKFGVSADKKAVPSIDTDAAAAK